MYIMYNTQDATIDKLR